MKENHKASRIFLSPIWFLWIVLALAGCAHKNAAGKAYAEQTVEASSKYEKSGDLLNAVEELKVALVADPNNSAARDELNRMLAKQKNEAETHFKNGLSLRGSDPQKARREFLEALIICNNYPEAERELRGIQLSLAQAVILARTKEEKRLASIKMRGGPESSEDEESAGEAYSLDVAIASFEKGDFDSAIREFSKMLAHYPNDPDIKAYLDRSYYNVGIKWFNKNEYNKALTFFSHEPKGFDNVDDYISKCKLALKTTVKRR
jgi:Flp pilus assembly protein TadD